MKNLLDRDLKIEQTIALLTPLLILLNYLGRGLFNTALAIIALMLIYTFYKNKEQFHIILRDKLVLYWSVFAIFVAISVPFAINFKFSISKFDTFLFSSYVPLLASLFLYVYSINKQKNFLLAIKIFFFTAIVMESITIFNITNGMDLLHYIKTSEIRPQLNSYHLREVFTSAIMPLIIMYYYYKPSRIKLLLIIVSFVGILASTSRTAMIATLISLFVYILIKNRFKIFNRDFIVMPIIVILAMGISFYISPEIKQRVESFKTTFTSKGDRMSGRFTVYKESFEYFLKSPIVGNGIKSANYLHKKNLFTKIGKHPHNIWLEILMDSGIVGMIGFLSFVGYLLLSVIKAKTDSSLIKATMWATLISVALSSLASWSIWSGNHIGSFMVLVVIIYSLRNLQEDEVFLALHHK